MKSSKQKNTTAIEEEAALETELIESSAELARDFLDDKLLPLIDEFEFNNDDPDYISGMAIYGLFIEMATKLIEAGYTEKDLRKELKICLNSSMGETLH